MRQSSKCSFVQSLVEKETSVIAEKKSAKRSSFARLEHRSKIKSRSINEDLLQEHLNQSDCSLNQNLNLNDKKTFNSTSTELTSINCIAFSSQISYLIIENLYHKQKALLVKVEKELKTKVLEIKIYLEELERLDAKKIAEQVVVQAKKAVAAAQKAMKQEAVVVEKTVKQVVMKAVKSETCSKDINFFDSIMMMNLSELHFSVNCASFLQNLNEQAVKYQKSSVLKALQTSFRDSALI